MPLTRTPLYDQSLALNARMTEFSGWEMPVQYQGIKQEHQAVRQAAGMFDISHMGKFTLVGQGVIDQLQRLVPTDLSGLVPGKAQYTVLLNPQGGVIDDLIVYLQAVEADGTERAIAIVNAATTDKDKSWLLEQLDTQQVLFQDQSREQALIAVQGPAAVAKLQTLVATDLAQVKRYWHTTAKLLGETAFLARTGYTGEDGFEVMVPANVATKVWQALIDAGVVPCGLGARDTLRLEAAMALYGQDVNDTITPLEAGLSWLVHLDKKGDFIGRAVLDDQKTNGVTRRLVGLQMEGRNIARHDYLIQHEAQSVGVVTSGTLSPTLGMPIALGYVPQGLSKVGQTLSVEIRGKLYPATVVKRPFYKAQK
ncbi:MAG: glycine cleavage system aminomethyltransferase GcvT [Cyanobacteria bacterium P01_A01_bin.123]